jgi:hypothetical protein
MSTPNSVSAVCKADEATLRIGANGRRGDSLASRRRSFLGRQGEVDADFEGDGVVGGEHLEAAFVETDMAEGDAFDAGEMAGQAGRFAQGPQDALEGLVHHHAGGGEKFVGVGRLVVPSATDATICQDPVGEALSQKSRIPRALFRVNRV